MNIVLLHTQGGVLHWVRLGSQPGSREFAQLADHLGALGCRRASRFVLDFSAVDHLDYRSVPHLLGLVRAVEGHAAEVRVVGMSDYLRRILDFGGALDGRDFLERCAPVAPPVPASPAAPGSRLAATTFVAPPRTGAPSGPDPASRVSLVMLRRVTLSALEALANPSMN